MRSEGRRPKEENQQEARADIGGEIRLPSLNRGTVRKTGFGAWRGADPRATHVFGDGAVGGKLGHRETQILKGTERQANVDEKDLDGAQALDKEDQLKTQLKNTWHRG